MWTFLGLGSCLVFVTISGHKEETITGFYGQSVLMPCQCSDRSLEKTVTWQRDAPMLKILTHRKNTSTFDDRYKDRARIFLNEDSNNCSVLILNLTLSDQGNYRCSFFDPSYCYVNITLKVVASYTVCLQSISAPQGRGPKVFQCDVRGNFQGAQIDWELDGQPPPNASTTTQNHSSNGLYHVNSNLTLQLDDASKLKCVVKNPKILPHTSDSCNGVKEPLSNNVSKDFITVLAAVLLAVFIIVIVIGIFAFRRYRKRTKEDEEQRDPDTINIELEQLYQTTR